MKENIHIDTVAFEGLHRSGKGTQIEIIKQRLDELGVPSIVIRGAGSRENKGEDVGDKYSEWWESHLKKIKGPVSTKEDWIEGARRLARETLVFRDRILPQYAQEMGVNRAVLLIDRTILSHLAIIDDKTKDALNIDEEHVYGKRDERNRILPETREIFPDVIFYLKAKPEVLLSRLDPNDPKFEFRKKNILENTTSFDTAIEALPTDLKEDIINIDASQKSEVVAEEIFRILTKKINLE